MADSWNRKLKLLTIHGGLQCQTRCDSRPCDVAVINRLIVVVSFPEEKKLKFYEIDISIKVVHEIETRLPCIGVTVLHRMRDVIPTAPSDHGLVVSTQRSDSPPSVIFMSMDGTELLSISNDHRGVGLFGYPRYLAIHEERGNIWVLVGDSDKMSVTQIGRKGAVDNVFHGICHPQAFLFDRDGNRFQIGNTEFFHWCYSFWMDPDLKDDINAIRSCGNLHDHQSNIIFTGRIYT